MKDKKCFSDQMNRNRFDPVLARRNWSCSTMKNLTCPNFAVNKLMKQSVLMSHPRFRVNVHFLVV